MLDTFFLGWTLSGVTIIDDLEWIVDNLEFLDNIELSLGLPGGMCIWSSSLSQWSMGMSLLFVSPVF